MATVRFGGEESELPDDSAVHEVCEDMGAPFGCTDGLFGRCRCMVVEGFEDLEPPSKEEKNMDLKKIKRLACQCVIKSVIVHFEHRLTLRHAAQISPGPYQTGGSGCSSGHRSRPLLQLLEIP